MQYSPAKWSVSYEILELRIEASGILQNLAPTRAWSVVQMCPHSWGTTVDPRNCELFFTSTNPS